MLVEHLARHAVAAAEVAAIGDRDPQVAQRPPSRVGEMAGRRRRIDRHRRPCRRIAVVGERDHHAFGHASIVPFLDPVAAQATRRSARPRRAPAQCSAIAVASAGAASGARPATASARRAPVKRDFQ